MKDFHGLAPFAFLLSAQKRNVDVLMFPLTRRFEVDFNDPVPNPKREAALSRLKPDPDLNFPVR